MTTSQMICDAINGLYVQTMRARMWGPMIGQMSPAPLPPEPTRADLSPDAFALMILEGHAAGLVQRGLRTRDGEHEWFLSGCQLPIRQEEELKRLSFRLASETKAGLMCELSVSTGEAILEVCGNG